MNKQHEPFLMAMFGHVLDKNKDLYRATKRDSLDLGHLGKGWYTQEVPRDGKKYGNLVYQFKTPKSLRLINLSSMLFKHHFLDQMNLRFSSRNEEEFHRKQLALMALGFPMSVEEQTKFISEHDVQTPHNTPCKFQNPTTDQNINQHVIEAAKYFFSHRFSEYSLDLEMAEVLKETYGNVFDGYIIPVDLPTCWHKYFPSEICLFKPALLKLTFVRKFNIKSTKNTAKNTPKKGGYSNKIKLYADAELVLSQKMMSENDDPHPKWAWAREVDKKIEKRVAEEKRISNLTPEEHIKYMESLGFEVVE